MFIEVLASSVNSAWFHVGRITHSQKNRLNKQAGQDRCSPIRTLHLKSVAIYLHRLCTAQRHPGHVVKPVSWCSHLDYGGGAGKGSFLLNPSTKTRGTFSYVPSKFWRKKKPTDQHHENPHFFFSYKAHGFSQGSLYTAEVGDLARKALLVLPLPVTPQLHLQAPHHLPFSGGIACPLPLQAWVKPRCPPTQPLTVQLALINSPQALPTSWQTGPSSMHPGRGGQRGMRQAHSEPSQTC